MENAAHPHKAAVLRVIPGDELEVKSGQTPTSLVGDPLPSSVKGHKAKLL